MAPTSDPASLSLWIGRSLLFHLHQTEGIHTTSRKGSLLNSICLLSRHSYLQEPREQGTICPFHLCERSPLRQVCRSTKICKLELSIANVSPRQEHIFWFEVPVEKTSLVTEQKALSMIAIACAGSNSERRPFRLTNSHRSQPSHRSKTTCTYSSSSK